MATIQDIDPLEYWDTSLEKIEANFQALNDDKQETSEKGQANWYASLDSAGKVPTTQIPTWVGLWDMISGNNLSDVENVSTARDNLWVQYGTTAWSVLEGDKDAEYSKLDEDNTFTSSQTFQWDILHQDWREFTNTGTYSQVNIRKDSGGFQVRDVRKGFDNLGVQGDLVTRFFDRYDEHVVQVSTSGNTFFNGGNVWMGITSPLYTLHTNSGGDDVAVQFETSYWSSDTFTRVSEASHFFLKNWNSTSTWGIAPRDDGRLSIWEDWGDTDPTVLSTDYMTFLPNGNVWINNPSPWSKLSVVGLPTSASGLSSWDTYTQTASQLWGSGATKVLCIV